MAVAASDLAIALRQDEIPFKLRCASCNNLVVDAFRLPCCDQNVCENCQTSLPESCPVCMHNPLSVNDCKPNKSLRLTVKAFVKSEEKKRRRECSVTDVSTLSYATTSDQRPAPIIAEELAVLGSGCDTVSEPGQLTSRMNNHNADFDRADDIEAAPSSPSSSVEITLEAPNHDRDNHRVKGFGPTFGNVSTQDYGERRPRTMEDFTQSSKAPAPQDLQVGSGDVESNFVAMNSFDAMSNASVMGSMGTVQNAFIPAYWTGLPNMMGMPAMGLEFMSAYQGMFGGFNRQAMGFYGVNNHHVGTSFEGGYGSMGYQITMGLNADGSGKFGANPGFYPSSGYNQRSHPNFPNQMHHNHFPINNYKRNRFQGQSHHRGNERGCGRHVTYPQPSKSSFQIRHEDDQTNPIHGPAENLEKSSYLQRDNRKTVADATISKQTDELDNGKGEHINANCCDSEQVLAELDEGSNGFEPDMKLEAKRPNYSSLNGDHIARSMESEYEDPREMTGTDIGDAKEPEMLHRIPIRTSTEPAITSNDGIHDLSLEQRNALPEQAELLPTPNSVDVPTAAEASSQGEPGETRGTFRCSQDLAVNYSDENSKKHASQTLAPKGQGVEGAPTGPKSMRDGLLNSRYRGRGGFPVVDKPGRQGSLLSINGPSASEPCSQIGSEIHELQSPKEPKLPCARQNRNSSRSTTNSNNDVSEPEYYKTVQTIPRQVGVYDQDREANHSAWASTPRSTSRHRRRRSSRNRSSSPHQRNGSLRNGRSALRSHSELRPNSEVSRGSESTNRFPKLNSLNPLVHGPAKESEGKRSDTESLTSPTRGYVRRAWNRDDHVQHERHQKKYVSNSKTSLNNTVAFQSPTNEFKIKDRSKQTAPDFRSTITEGKGCIVDPHNIEREARNRERLAKEQQRRDTLAAATSGSAGKRIRDIGSDDANTKSSRRKLRNDLGSSRHDRVVNYQYDEDEESRESRALRVETEREAARWA